MPSSMSASWERWKGLNLIPIVDLHRDRTLFRGPMSRLRGAMETRHLLGLVPWNGVGVRNSLLERTQGRGLSWPTMDLQSLLVALPPPMVSQALATLSGSKGIKLEEKTTWMRWNGPGGILCALRVCIRLRLTPGLSGWEFQLQWVKDPSRHLWA